MLNALSIDVEDWYHPELVREHAQVRGAQPQIEEAIRPIVGLLDRHQVKATFFFVGEIAQAAPGLVEMIASKGHEIGCHGMTHRMLADLGPEVFREELGDFARVMSSVGIDRVAGFRASTFSLDERTRWAIPILADAGYAYDSSIFPMRNPMYGVAGCPLTPYPIGDDNIRRPDPDSKLWEFPMSVWQMGPLKIPVSGGFYLRALPGSCLRALLRQINANGRPFVIYAHPWETYSGTPRLGLAPLSKWVTYANIERTLPKLERLIETFRFTTLDQVLARWKTSRAQVRSSATSATLGG